VKLAKTFKNCCYYKRRGLHMSNTNDVIAVPSKAFFIDMLVRDVALLDAVVDLVDNSVDAANRSAAGGPLTSYWARITLGSDSFKIEDNCGGMTIKDARERAFRFGRSPIPALDKQVSTVASPSPSTALREIGQFGVGMKRTIFKLGRMFHVTSRTSRSRFTIDQDVDKWIQSDGPEWHFSFSEVVDETDQAPPFGTTVIVSRLHHVVAEQIKTENFAILLAGKIQSAHPVALTRGLSISINGIPVTMNVSGLLSSEVLQPASRELSIPVPGKGEVFLRIVAGVVKPPGENRERGLKDGGWYIFCNERQILRADQSSMTGWGTESIPQYHPNYAFFRGYAFFSSNDGSLLPWTTTKTGVDGDSPVFRRGIQEAIDVMRPVITFLQQLEDERSKKKRDEIEDTPLHDAMAAANSVAVSNLPPRTTFVALDASRKPLAPRTTVRVQYDAKIADVDRVKKKLRVGSASEAGSGTFKYYLEMECD
jgi:hypothetical protein